MLALSSNLSFQELTQRSSFQKFPSNIIPNIWTQEKVPVLGGGDLSQAYWAILEEGFSVTLVTLWLNDCCRAVLYTAEGLTASWASTHLMPVELPRAVTIKFLGTAKCFPEVKIILS